MRAILQLFLLCPVLFAAAGAGENPPSGPANEPAAFLFAPNPDIVERLAGTRPLLAAGLGDRDFPARLPGLGKISSLRMFFERLRLTGATDFWLCLPDVGRSAMGWTMPADDAARETVELFLDQSGINPGKTYISLEDLPGKGIAVAVAPNPATLKWLAVPQKPPSGGGNGEQWREALAEVAGVDDGIGLWLNPRQLSGITALLTGVDVRPFFRDAGYPFPSAVVVRLRDNHGELGLHLALHGQFQDQTDAAVRGGHFNRYAVPPPVVLDFRLPNPAPFARRPGRLPSLPGVDIGKFVPTDVSLALWSDPSGGLSARASLALRHGTKPLNDFVRLGTYLAALFSFPGAGVAVETAPEAAWIKLAGRNGDITLLLERDDGDGSALHILCGDHTAAPGPSAGAEEAPARPPGLRWRLLPDADMRKTAAGRLSAGADKTFRFNPGPEFWTAIAGISEDGGIDLTPDRLRLDSPNGGILWLVPLIWNEFDSRLRPLLEGGQTTLAAGRLRFLLEAANRSRYRAVTAGNRRIAPLPSNLSQLAFAGEDGRAWLDNALPVFPGYVRPNYPALRKLSEGSAMDGYRYAIETGDGDWSIIATPDSHRLPALKIDPDGGLWEWSAQGVWQPRETALADLLE